MHFIISCSILSAISASVVAAPFQKRVEPADLTHKSWDVIVVGSGPAGIIVADRMSEAGKRTLLLEGGGPSYAFTGGTDKPGWLNGTGLSRVDVPGLYKSIFADQGELTCKNWTNAFGGCAIGGSGAVNAGLAFEPPATDWDIWFPEGWKSTDMKDAIKRTYDRVPTTETYSQDGKFYLQSGYEAAKKWLVDSAGYDNVHINEEADKKFKVFGRPVFAYENGQRGGPATTYLKSSLKRSNFLMQTGARVQRVLRKGDQATGVLATINGVDYSIPLCSRGRVVLSAGALQSPQLLWNSGIGSSAMQTNMTAAGKFDNQTTWIENDAVGEGLYDNPNTFIELKGPSISSYVHNYSSPDPVEAKMYIEERSGPYSFASETSAFWDYTIMPDGHRAIGFQGTIDSAGFGEYTENGTITLNVYGTSGLYSSGRVLLGENGLPGPSPDVYYSDPRDADAIAGFIRSIFDHLDPNLLTPLNIPLNATKDEIRAYITSETPYTRGQVNHWSSSCRIGSCVDKNTVVRGMKNLHVVDGSIVEPLSVNPQFGIMMAAERASDLILAL